MMDENKKAAQKKKVSHFITIAVLVILFLAFIFPFIMVIFNAFKTKGDITADPLALVGSHGFILTNFTDAMKKMNFATSFTNSLLITTVSTILTIMLSAMTAFVIVRNKWKACGILFSLMIASMVIPFQVLMIPLVSLYGGIFGVLNSRITLILMWDFPFPWQHSCSTVQFTPAFRWNWKKQHLLMDVPDGRHTGKLYFRF